MPVVIVASEQDQARGISAGVTDWLIKPFSSAYARTKVRAWALRSACKATRRPLPSAKSSVSVNGLCPSNHRGLGRSEHKGHGAPRLPREPRTGVSRTMRSARRRRPCYGCIAERSPRLKRRALGKRSASLLLTQQTPPQKCKPSTACHGEQPPSRPVEREPCRPSALSDRMS